MHETVLAVDLDGTLIKGDVTEEGFIQLLKSKPQRALKAIFLFLFRGNAKFKEYLAKNTSIDPKLQLYSEEFIQFLTEQKNQGRKLVLISASHQDMVEKFKGELFDEAFGTTRLNLVGIRKARLLKRKYDKFDYAGNAWVDFQVFKESQQPILVNPTPRMRKIFEKKYPSGLIFGEKLPFIKALLKAIRPIHWFKNLLIFVPAVLSHSVNLPNLINLLSAFFLFSLTCSATYLINDLFDIDSDRMHSEKKNRPIASGDLSSFHALFVAFTLIFISMFMSFIYYPTVFLLQIFYLLLNYLYSTVIKKVLILDIFTLSIFYLIRIFLGASLTEVELSGWFMAFSLFGFLSLASLKRYSELFTQSASFGRQYLSSDSSFFRIFGISCGLLSSLVYLLYLNSYSVDALYSNTFFLWLVFPILLYWYSKTWLLVCRGENLEDPVLSVLSSRENLGLFLLCLAFFLLAL